MNVSSKKRKCTDINNVLKSEKVSPHDGGTSLVVLSTRCEILHLSRHQSSPARTRDYATYTCRGELWGGTNREVNKLLSLPCRRRMDGGSVVRIMYPYSAHKQTSLLCNTTVVLKHLLRLCCVSPLRLFPDDLRLPGNKTNPTNIKEQHASSLLFLGFLVCNCWLACCLVELLRDL